MTVTFWGRVGDPASAEAHRFLRQNGYRPDHVRDMARTPPTPDEMRAVLRGMADPRGALAPDAGDAPPEADLAAWLLADPRRLRAPMLLTPRGAVCGFGERAWSQFLGLGPLRGG